MNSWDEMVEYTLRENDYKGFHCTYAGMGKIVFTNGNVFVESIQDTSLKGLDDRNNSWLVHAWKDCKNQIDSLIK